ncbi:MAG TPA: amidohydrolase/deacetylase family metallohydrolase [Thermomicrobiales bacterium]|nr:amidohydrolase/deacetylase family metallohydrolase [Thermomicrobiales bacterium]
MSASPGGDAPRLLLKGGHIIDPANGRDGPADLRLAGGTVVAVGSGLTQEVGETAIDVSGLVVTPGLIDMHAHCAISHPRSKLSLDPHVQTFSAGVTTVVDAGTCGARDFSDFRERVIDAARIRVLAFVNIVDSGMGGDWEHDVREMQPKLAAGIARKHAEVVVGIKTAHYWTHKPFDAAHPAWAAVDAAVEAGDLAALPVMVDFFPFLPERPYERLVLEKLRPGDIHTHVYAQQFPVLDAEGRVGDHLWRARERGVLFDLGHGAASFWFRHAVPAIRQGFPPDTISTDLHTGNVNGPVFDQLTTINKILAAGMPLPEVIARSTVEPARLLRRPALGTLTPGAEADVAIFALDEGPASFVDCGRAVLRGDRRLRCLLTLRAGMAVFNPTGFGLLDWEDAILAT